MLTAAPTDHLPSQDRRLQVMTQTVHFESSCTLGRTYTGTIKAARESDLSFDMTARLTEINVDEGSRVTKGQVLGRVDSRNLLARLRQIRAEHDAAVAVLAELKAGPRAETIQAARAEVSRAEAELAIEQADLARNKSLLSNNAIAVSEFDRVKFAHEARTASVTVAQQRLAELEAGTRHERIAAQAALVAQLAASIDNVNVDIEDTQLRAPFSGTIAHRHADEGLVVGAGQAVLTLVEDSKLEAWIGLPVKAADTLGVGDAIALLVDGQTLDAAVISISPQLDHPTRTRRVRARLSDASGASIVPGQIVRLVIDQRIDTQGFWLPTSAISQGARGLWTLYVVANGGVVERRDVEVLHTQGNRVFVRGTVSDRERVITQGIHRVAPGQRVDMQ